ncbi:MAG: hypothetical protein ACPLRS_01725 [Hydrogenobacter sp.]
MIEEIIAQHELYLKRLKFAILHRKEFQHKDCGRKGLENACHFGKKLYMEILPTLQDASDEVKRIVMEIEELHCEFHEVSKTINPLNPLQEQVNSMKTVSLRLYQKLLQLKSLLK